jgi:hypothetical protein
MTSEQAYTVLGVEPGTTPKEVQLAYRRQAMKYHPDRAGSADESEYFTRKFLEIRDAYEFLRDEGFPVPETRVVLEDVYPVDRLAGRSFKPRDPHEARRFLKETSYEVKTGPGAIVLWCVVIPGSAVTIVLVMKWLFEKLMTSVPQP